MSLRLIPPRPKRPAYYVKGTHCGRFVNRSTRTRDKALARKFLRKWEQEIERGEFADPGEPTFAGAAIAYMNAGGDRRPMARLLRYFGELPLSKIDQAAIDRCATALFPNPGISPATVNREVYTPVSAVLKRAGRRIPLSRPKGSRGRVVTRWLWPEQAFSIFEAARGIDQEFAIFLEQLCYTGARLGDALSLWCADVRLSESFAYVGKTKSGNPRPVHLPPYAVASLANHPRGLDRMGERVFKFKKGGALYFLLEAACRVACGLPMPERTKWGRRQPRQSYELDWVNFHTFRHTWGTWMRRYAKLDTRGLVATGVWESERSAARYAHVVASEEAQRADLLPTPETMAGTLEFPPKKLASNQ